MESIDHVLRDGVSSGAEECAGFASRLLQIASKSAHRDDGRAEDHEGVRNLDAPTFKRLDDRVEEIDPGPVDFFGNHFQRPLGNGNADTCTFRFTRYAAIKYATCP